MAEKKKNKPNTIEITVDYNERPTGMADLTGQSEMNVKEQMIHQLQNKNTTDYFNDPNEGMAIEYTTLNDRPQFKITPKEPENIFEETPSITIHDKGLQNNSKVQIENGGLTGEALKKYMEKQDFIEKMTSSATADKLGIDNTPLGLTLEKLEYFYENVILPLKEKYGDTIQINSGYRSEDLNTAIGGSGTSDHMRGKAGDMEITGVDNKEVAEWIRDNIPNIEQLILENYEQGQAASGWIHLAVGESNKGKARLQSAFQGYDGKWKYVDGLMSINESKAKRWITPREMKIEELTSLMEAAKKEHCEYKDKSFILWNDNKPTVPPGIQKQIDELSGKANAAYALWRKYEKEIEQLTLEILFLKNGWYADKVDPVKDFQ